MTEYTANQHGEVIKSNEYMSLTAHRRIVDKLEKRIKELEKEIEHDDDIISKRADTQNRMVSFMIEKGIMEEYYKIQHKEEFYFTKYGKMENDGMVLCMVCFVPKHTLKLGGTPGLENGYIRGKTGSCWIKYPKGKAPKTKEEFERIVGMSVLSVE